MDDIANTCAMFHFNDHLVVTAKYYDEIRSFTSVGKLALGYYPFHVIAMSKQQIKLKISFLDLHWKNFSILILQH